MKYIGLRQITLIVRHDMHRVGQNGQYVTNVMSFLNILMQYSHFILYRIRCDSDTVLMT